MIITKVEGPVYLSGPMSGFHNFNRDVFDGACKFLRDKIGVTVNSPHEVNEPCPEPKWEDWMRADLILLLRSKTVITLDHWQTSRGARIEVELAHSLGFLVLPYSLIYASYPITVDHGRNL